MKLNYVSVLKEYQQNNKGGGYYVRGELDGQPTAIWFKHFRLIWATTMAYRRICPEPKLNLNEIVISIKDGNSIPAAVEALRTVVSKVCNPYIKSEDTLFLEILMEAII